MNEHGFLKQVTRFVVSGLFSIIFLDSPARAQVRDLSLRSSPACRSWVRTVTGDRNSDGGMKTDQIVVARGNGEVLFQWADGAFKLNTPHELYSASKTITATIAAVAINQGKLKLNDRLSAFLPASDRQSAAGVNDYEKITIDDLLSMTSGFKWSERTTDKPQQASDLAMFYGTGYHDMVQFALQQKFAAAPGRVWNYSSLNANLLFAALKKIYGKAAYDDMPWVNLFQPLGITSAHIEQDAAHNYIGAAYVFLSVLDMAKIGELYLNNGMYNGQQLLPMDWVTHARQLVPASRSQIHTQADLDQGGPYAHGSFWINVPVKNLGRPLPHSPASLYYADGLFGQFILILPEQNLVIARTGHDLEFSNKKLDTLTSGAIACFQK